MHPTATYASARNVFGISNHTDYVIMDMYLQQKWLFHFTELYVTS